MFKIAATTAPFGRVLRIEFETPVMARVVEVAFVVVAFPPVKFWRVVEPRAIAPPVRVVRPPTATVPVKFAVEEIC